MSRFAEYFDRIYIINLAYRRDRRQEMREQLARIGMSFSDPNVTLFSAVRPDNRGEFDSIGAQGCFLSHLQILKDAARESLSRILILEDDLDFTPDFTSRSMQVLRGLVNNQWSMFYGGYRLATSLGTPDSDSLCFVPSQMAVGTTHFIGVQGPAIGRIADTLSLMLGRRAGDPNGGPMHVDGAYTWYRWLNPVDVTLAAVPELGYQRSSKTDVHPLQWHDRTPVIRAMVSKLRWIKNRVTSL